MIVGTVAFDAIETPFGKTDKILGGAGFSAGIFEILVERNIDISGLEVVKGERHGAVVTVTI
jgi:hypothetical protein